MLAGTHKQDLVRVIPSCSRIIVAFRVTNGIARKQQREQKTKHIS